MWWFSEERLQTLRIYNSTRGKKKSSNNLATWVAKNDNREKSKLSHHHYSQGIKLLRKSKTNLKPKKAICFWPGCQWELVTLVRGAVHRNRWFLWWQFTGPKSTTCGWKKENFWTFIHVQYWFTAMIPLQVITNNWNKCFILHFVRVRTVNSYANDVPITAKRHILHVVRVRMVNSCANNVPITARDTSTI
jgi:hypothetical protein